MSSTSPPAHVLTAFQISEEPIFLPGGQGEAFRAGNYVLKPAENVEEIAWSAQVLSSIRQEGFRVAKYKQALSGVWTVDGWFAQEYLEGAHANDRWPEVLRACSAFHNALIAHPQPTFIAGRTDPWAVADRAAWGEVPFDYDPRLAELLDPLVRLLQPVQLMSQVIHGDFSNNVLFAEGLPPAVIDFSPYWRPAPFASAIVVVDALTWHEAETSIFDEVADLPEIDQMLLRAEIRRIMEIDGQFKQYGRDGFAQITAHRPVVELLCSRLR